MQIVQNTTAMAAGIAMATDKDGRDFWVVVIKGTFVVGSDGEAALAENPEPLVYADAHHEDPATSSIKYECDFAPFKPRADILINGHAITPSDKPTRRMTVAVEVGSISKHVTVFGDRQWERGVFGLRPSAPAPFVKMPLLFERAFGGSDHTHDNPKHQGTDLRNPVGLGFHKNSDSGTISGTPLPNLEDPADLISKWSDTPRPMGFGAIGRGWQPRIRHAGTYDDRWLNERFPYLPADFDQQYFQSAPADQQAPYLQGGERVRCSNMTPEGIFLFSVPMMQVSILYRFRDRNYPVTPTLDTLIVEPDERRCLLIWRASVPVGRKLNALREVLIGPPPGPERPMMTRGKPHFNSLAELANWRQRKG